MSRPIYSQFLCSKFVLNICPGGRECWETINPFEFVGSMKSLKYA